MHDVLTRLKAQPHIYPTIDVSYSPSEPLAKPVVLSLPLNGFRLRFDGPDQRLRLIEVYDFTKTPLSYKNIEVVKLSDKTASPTTGTGTHGTTGPVFRHVYHRLMGPSFPGEYVPPDPGLGSNKGLYILSYPGIAFTFPLQDTAWSPNVDFVSLLSSNAAAPAKCLAMYDGQSWPEARQDLMARPCPNPRSLALSSRGKELRPDEIDLVKIRGGGVVELLRRSSNPFNIILSKTTPQDLVTELGQPDAIYRKYDRRLSIHKTQNKNQKPKRRSSSSSQNIYEDSTDTDQSSNHTATEESDAEDQSSSTEQSKSDLSVECFYNYFHHGFDVFISYPTYSSPGFGPLGDGHTDLTDVCDTDQLVATKILLHGNVPGSYPFNRYRRSRWCIETNQAKHENGTLNSETPFAELSRHFEHGFFSDAAKNQLHKGMVLNRGWGDSPGSSCELLGGWEESTDSPKVGSSSQSATGSLGFGNTQLFGYPGLVFEVLKNDSVSCLTVY